MRTGLLFGSYNPIHNGHLLLATRIREFAGLDEIWLVVSPQNPHKAPAELAPEEHRLNMVKLAIEQHPFLKACDIEFSLSRPSYTHQTLKELQKQFIYHDFHLIIGEDNIEKFGSWKESEWIKNNFDILVYNRTLMQTIPDLNFKIITLPLIDISATEIRKRVMDKKSIRYYVPETVESYILQHHLFT